MRLPPYLEQDMNFPDFFRVRVACPESNDLDIAETVVSEVRSALGRFDWRPGERVAVGVGSRGIAHLKTIVRSACSILKAVGLKPVVLPAMGSHGGATAEGQRAVLESLGIRTHDCSAEICAAMEVEKLGTVFGEVPVWFSRDALSADHSICINRIKPHTKFKASVESGVLKMLCVGMGKHEGALSYHRWAIKHGFYPLLLEMGKVILRESNFRFGLAVVEDALDRPFVIEAVEAARVLEREPELLEIAKAHFPRLPVKDLDVLVVERIGKEVSGAGMDPNVTGRAYDLGESDFSEVLKAKRVAVLNLSETTAGNGLGLGNADIITEKVFRNLDYGRTLMNGLTSLSLRKVFIPVRMPDDRKAIQACFATLGPTPPEAVRAVIIRDTLHVSDFLASRSLVEKIETLPNTNVELLGQPEFNEKGDWLSPWETS